MTPLLLWVDTQDILYVFMICKDLKKYENLMTCCSNIVFLSSLNFDSYLPPALSCVKENRHLNKFELKTSNLTSAFYVNICLQVKIDQ